MSAKKAEPEATLEEKICECAKQCGLTPDEAKVAMGSASGGPVGAIGDGVFLGKFLDFVKTLLPIILPLIVKEPPA